MYTLESLRQGFESPRLVAQEFNRLYHRRLRSWSYNRAGVDVFGRDWDSLLILDACRYDLFERVSDLPGELEAVTSRGSATKEFLRGNLHGREFLDTVYVTASPMLYRLRDSVDTRFHAVVNVWKENGWNEEYRTVMPKTVTDAALSARDRYPNKRLLVHYLQPHYPFIGPIGREHFDLDRLDFEWDALLRGDLNVSNEVIWRAYEENLELVLPEVERFLRESAGKTVVTADHGQMFGGRSSPLPMREYGHPLGVYTDELVRVPWLTVRHGDRPSIEAGTPEDGREDGERGDGERRDEDLARERLQELGYLE